MNRKEIASLGGQIMAKRQREEAEQKYYTDPNYCLHCGELIKLGGMKVSQVKKKKFCDRSCAASFNNKGKIKNRVGCNGITPVFERNVTCQKCGSLFVQSRKTSGGFGKRKYCDGCLRVDKIRFLSSEKLDMITLGELKERATYWVQFRTAIAKHARRVYRLKTKNRICEVCGYHLHIDICHKKPVAEFEDNQTLKEINDSNNLIGLCRNCHWELDHGILNLSRDRLE